MCVAAVADVRVDGVCSERKVGNGQQSPPTLDGGRSTPLTWLADGIRRNDALGIFVGAPRGARLRVGGAGTREVADGVDGRRCRKENRHDREDTVRHCALGKLGVL